MNTNLTYKQHLKSYPQKDIVVRYPDLNNRCVVFNPSINSVRPGQMVRVWSVKGRDTWGTVIESVNKDTKQVLIRDNIGGIKEHSTWVSVDVIQQVWGDKTYDQAMDLIKDFSREVNRVLYKREMM